MASGKEHPDIARAVRDGFQFLRRHGMTLSKPLASGKNGTTYELSDGRVLKVTRDTREARASMAVMGKDIPHVVRIYSVFRMPNSQRVNMYGILQERLTPLSSIEAREVEDAIVIFDRALGFTIWEKSWKEFLRRVSKLEEPPQEVEWALGVLRDYSIDKMMDGLKRAGVDYYDYHAGNIMRRGNREYVITDLGLATAPGVDVPVLEQDAGGDEFVELLLRNKAALVKRNIRPVKELGAGSRGVAFKLRDGGVLKVTTDLSEAQASMKVMKRGEIPGVVRVTSVFSFPPDRKVYGIVQEELRPLSNQEASVMKVATRLMVRLFQRDMDAYRWGWAAFLDSCDKRLRALGYSSKDREFQDIVKAVKVFKSLGIDRMMDGLYQAGVLFHDYHPGNIMRRRNGEYVVTDLGASHTEGVGEPELLESDAARDIPMLEGPSDQVFVVYAPLQPFSKRQAAFVRDLAEAGKVLLLLRPGKIPYARMRELVRASLPDAERSIETYDAPDEIEADRVASISPALRPGAAVTLYSDDPGHSAPLQTAGVVVMHRPIPQGISEDDEAVAAIRAGDIKSVMDPHVFSDRRRSERVRSMVGEGAIHERYLRDIGGVDGAKRVIVHNQRALERRLDDLGQLRFLGAGEKGAVFDIGKDRVLKVTSDAKDVSSAARLKGRNLSHVTHIHDVFQLKAPDGLAVEVFGIVSDKVEPLSDEEEAEFNRYFSEVRESPDADRLLSLLAMNRMDEFFDEFRASVARDLAGDAPDSPRIRQRVAAAVEQKAKGLWDVLRKYSVVKMVEELSKNGVQYADYKGDNIGRHRGEYVLLDVGGKSEGGGSPPMIADPDIPGGPVESVLRESRQIDTGDHKLDAWVARIVPAAVHYAVKICRTMKSCGVISNWIAAVSRQNGHECLVASRPRHFYNIFPLRDGRALMLDVTALQFKLPAGGPADTRDRDEQRAIKAAFVELERDPFSHIEMRILDSVPAGAREPEYNDEFGITLGQIERNIADPIDMDESSIGGDGTFEVYRATNDKDPLRMTHRGGSDYGPALYFATAEEDTRPYGPKARRYRVTLRNPIHVGQNEDPKLLKRVQRALRIDDDYVMDGDWAELMSLAGVQVELGQLTWAAIMKFLQKTGHDGIYVHSPKSAKGDYVGVFDPSQVEVLPDSPTGPQESLSPSMGYHMVRPGRSRLSTRWANGGAAVDHGQDHEGLEEMTVGNMVRVLGISQEDAEKLKRTFGSSNIPPYFYARYKKEIHPDYSLEHFLVDEEEDLRRLIAFAQRFPQMEKKLREAETVEAALEIMSQFLVQRGVGRPTTPPLLRLAGGFNWFHLQGDQCDIEGGLMQHCGRATGTMVSLRGPDGKPHVTADMVHHSEYDPVDSAGGDTKGREWIIVQLRGKQNSSPDEKYWPQIIDLVRTYNAVIDDEIVDPRLYHASLAAVKKHWDKPSAADTFT